VDALPAALAPAPDHHKWYVKLRCRIGRRCVARRLAAAAGGGRAVKVRLCCPERDSESSVAGSFTDLFRSFVTLISDAALRRQECRIQIPFLIQLPTTTCLTHTHAKGSLILRSSISQTKLSFTPRTLHFLSKNY